MISSPREQEDYQESWWKMGGGGKKIGGLKDGETTPILEQTTEFTQYSHSFICCCLVKG